MIVDSRVMTPISKTISKNTSIDDTTAYKPTLNFTIVKKEKNFVDYM